MCLAFFVYAMMYPTMQALQRLAAAPERQAAREQRHPRAQQRDMQRDANRALPAGEPALDRAQQRDAGQQEERLRLVTLLRARLDQLANLPCHPHISARREELLNILQCLTHP